MWVIIFEGFFFCVALYNDNWLQNVLLLIADSILGPGCMEPNGPRTVRRRESANHSVRGDRDDLDPWPAWAYKPHTISLLLIGACLLMWVSNFILLYFSVANDLGYFCAQRDLVQLRYDWEPHLGSMGSIWILWSHQVRATGFDILWSNPMCAQ